MPRTLQNLRKRVIGMLNAGMTMNAVVMNIGWSTRAIRHLRERFQATGRTEDRTRSGLPRFTTRGQYRYIRNTACAIASERPQLLLLKPMVHITTVYMPKLCTIAFTRLG